MALTGLFLCLFLVGHLAGNLQLIFGTPLQFNEYALFMTTNPAVKILSYVTYISILFHVVDGFLLTIQNRKARPVGYAKTNPGANSSFSSRNMAVLGTLVLIFIATHMTNFWAKMHFTTMPLQTITIDNGGQVSSFYITSGWGQDRFINVNQVDGENLIIEGNGFYYTKPIKVQFAEGYKDLHKITMDFFRSKEKLFGVIPNEGLFFTIFYVLSMAVLGFHLWHGFQSAFQSLGLNSPKWTPTIHFIGKAFAVLVPFLFAIIPLYIHFTK
ncbi:hypothetical protein GCM10011343_09490 [Flavobacterium orientale]|uniref:Succinate dehydrogenase n=2 Tax=Flavobacterium orientale TaxID=1756020 RepID=A0A916XZ50_9FLAO|nr:hypothetical protein GCM10011343_09490 [Flavobacterium orientale]